jgi:hypothetical protein
MFSFLKKIVKRLVIPVDMVEYTESIPPTEETLILQKTKRLQAKEIKSLYASCYIIISPYKSIVELTDKLKQHCYNIVHPNNDHFFIPNLNRSYYLATFINLGKGVYDIEHFYTVVIAYINTLTKEVEKNYSVNHVDILLQGQINAVLSAIEEISFKDE